MSENAFMFNNINVKKIVRENKNGFIEIRLYDGYDGLIYKNKARLNNKKEMKKLWGDLKLKGCHFKQYDDDWL